MLATFVVTNLLDTVGAAVYVGSLRYAILLSNANDDPFVTPDTIVFSDLAMEQGVQNTIQLTGGALDVTGPVSILGPSAKKLQVVGTGQDRVFNINDGDDDRNSNVRIGGLTITGGSRSGDGDENFGGGIFSTENLTVIESIVTGNTASRGGGGIAVGRGSLTVERSLIEGNRTGGNGGGILNGIADDVSPRTLIRNSTISGNEASLDGGFGGGAFNFRGTMDIQQSTFAENNAYYGMGVGSQGNPPPEEEGEEPPPPVVFTNIGGTIIADNANDILIPEGEDAPPPLPSIASLGFNIVVAGNMALGGNDLTDDPMLGEDGPELVDVGGIHDVYLPQPGSPAIDAGDPAAAGQFENRGRHFVRLYDYTTMGEGTPIIDIGAVEAQRGVFVVDELYDENDLQYTGVYLDDPIEGQIILGVNYTAQRDFTLREALEFSEKNPELDTIRFSPELVERPDLAPFTPPPTMRLDDGQITITESVIIEGPSTFILEVDASGSDPTPQINNSDGSRVFLINDGDNTSEIDVEISNLTLMGGDIVNSGGAILSFENLILDGMTFKDNAASNDGGALHLLRGTVEIRNSTFHNNFAADDGGAIYVDTQTAGLAPDDVLPTSLTLSNSTISGNLAGDRGAGVHNANGEMVVRYSTITLNQSGSLRGSGITSGQGGTQNAFTSTKIRSTILSGNGNNDVEQFGLSDPTIESLGYNFVGTGNASPQFQAAGDVTGQTNPMLKPLSVTGGLTPTHEPLEDSPVVDAGDPAAEMGVGDVPELDQRQFFYERIYDPDREDPENNGRIDIGAYELQGVTYVVTSIVDENDGDFTTPEAPTLPGLSLREAIQLANTSPLLDFITFDSSLLGRTIRVASAATLRPGTPVDMRITDSVVITGLGSGVLAIDGSRTLNALGSTTRVFTVDDNASSLLDVKMSGLTIRDTVAQQAGGTIFSRENLEIDDFFWVNNATFGDDFSGGVIHQRDGSLKINNSTITGNSTDGVNSNGGAIYGLDAQVEITYSTISGNSTSRTLADGGGVYVRNSSLRLFETTLTGNSTPGGQSDGGGFFANNSTVNVESAIIAGNLTTGSNSEGGGFYAFESNVNLDDVTVSVNRTNGTLSAGGGIYVRGGNLVANDSLISQNVTSGGSAHGAGIVNNGGIVQLVGTTVVGNRTTGAGAHGGGVYNLNGTTSISSSTVSANFVYGAGSLGGGVYSRTDGSLGQTRIVNSTLSGNVTKSHGGGVYNRGGDTLIQFSTITENSAPFYGFGGGVTSFGGAAARTQVLSSIIAGNGGSDVDIFGGTFQSTFQSLGYNLVGKGLVSDSFNAIGDRTEVSDPLLGPLANNGGPTLTHAPMVGSPAVNAGNPAFAPGSAGVPQFDQRGSGFSRVQAGRIDIGAVESTFSGFAADFNGDDAVNGFDFLIWQRNYDKSPALSIDGDANDDQHVDDADFAIWEGQFVSLGAGESVAAAIAPVDLGGASSGSLTEALAADVVFAEEPSGANAVSQAARRLGAQQGDVGRPAPRAAFAPDAAQAAVRPTVTPARRPAGPLDGQAVRDAASSLADSRPARRDAWDPDAAFDQLGARS